MKTTLDIPEELLLEAIRLSKSESKRAAVILALSDYIKRMRIEEAIGHEGNLAFSDDWERARHER